MKILTQREKNTLQTLAEQYMDIASLPVQQKKITSWKALNAGNMKRPMVVIDQIPWHELDSDESLRPTIEDTFWQALEKWLRMTIYKWKNFPADMVIEPFIPVPMAVESTYYGIEIQDDRAITDERSDIVGHRYYNQLCRYEDISKISDIQIKHNRKETEAAFNLYHDLLHDIAPLRLQGLQYHISLWDLITQWMGVESIYSDLIERPEFIHSILRRVTDATISGIKQANELRVHNDIANTCHCSYIYTDELLPAPGEGRGPESQYIWTFGMAQLFTAVSPDMTEEFELPYITELAEYYGGVYYGCCERLDDRLELLKKIPKVRKISCSPWSNRDAFTEKIGSKIVMSLKPSPAIFAMSAIDMNDIKKDLQHAVEFAARNRVNIEIILKDISTVNYDPGKLTDWNRIALEAVGGD